MSPIKKFSKQDLTKDKPKNGCTKNLTGVCERKIIFHDMGPIHTELVVVLKQRTIGIIITRLSGVVHKRYFEGCCDREIRTGNSHKATSWFLLILHQVLSLQQLPPGADFGSFLSSTGPL